MYYKLVAIGQGYFCKTIKSISYEVDKKVNIFFKIVNVMGMWNKKDIYKYTVVVTG